MIVKEVKYKDFDGNERKDKLYFNLSKVELLRLELEMEPIGGMSGFIDRMVENEDKATMLQFIEKILSEAYGEKSDDGRYFDKNPEISQRFINSAAYDALFDEIVMDETGDVSAELLLGILPDLSEYEKRVEEAKGVKTNKRRTNT